MDNNLYKTQLISTIYYTTVMNIILLDRATFTAHIHFPSPHLADWHWHEYAMTEAHELVPRARNAEVIITNKVALTGEILSQLPKLRLIAVAATGVDHIDLKAAQQREVAVCHVRNYAEHSVAEHVFALLLALQRQLDKYYQAVRKGSWSESATFTFNNYPITELYGATLGIIGAGVLGRAVARLGTAFGMHVLIAEQRAATLLRPGRTSFEQVLANSDVLSLHVPLNADTRHLISTEEFAHMKSSAVLINTARGGVVDEVALAMALRKGVIRGACIDVLSQEPPARDHPLLAMDLPNLIITPHIAWASEQAQQRLAQVVVANIEAFFQGKERNRVI